MKPNIISHTVAPFDFFAEQYTAYTPPIAPEYYPQACVRSCPRTLDYNSDSISPLSPPFPWAERLHPAGVHASAGPSIQWPLPAYHKQQRGRNRSQCNTSGLPTGPGHSSASGDGAGNNVPHTLHIQRDATTEEGGPSLGKGKRKRTAKDSPEDVPDEKQSPKRAQRHDPQQPERRMGDQPQKLTRQVVEHEPKGAVKDGANATEGAPIFRGNWYRERGTYQDEEEQVSRDVRIPSTYARLGPPVSTYPNQQTVPGTKEITLKGIYIGVGCVPLNGKERAAQERNAGIRKAVRKRTRSNKKQDQGPGLSN
ncbi:hypothetical protein HYPSUDRAFT_219861 [Hypholoma sublateritium FD-334 SS-4]|uniref:Uncharacterized protein n=1 Tax=Hypholoma sublateritium (strain FD-334 SS-4) TaxID=945553 RepID=A0A0D2KME9_HYPSF|nr:hypothetical protein HYPSUDRAFT_219861 [Hypholoma sublateritium FD-334 SS-4]